MELAFYEAAKSVKTTGDGAVVGYFDEGRFGYKTISYNDDNILYPHYNSLTGKARTFRSFLL